MTEYDEVMVHHSHQAAGWPDRVMVSKDQRGIHPSHEAYTKQPSHRVGETVLWLGKPCVVVEIRNSGTIQSPVFEYKLKLDGGEKTNFVRSSDIYSNK